MLLTLLAAALAADPPLDPAQFIPPDIAAALARLERPQPAPGAALGEPMSGEDFQALLASVEGEAYADARLRRLWWIVPGRAFSIDQLTRLMQAFPLSDDRVYAAVLVSPWVVDPENADRLDGHFPFPADREAVRALFPEEETTASAPR